MAVGTVTLVPCSESLPVTVLAGHAAPCTPCPGPRLAAPAGVNEGSVLPRVTSLCPLGWWGELGPRAPCRPLRVEPPLLGAELGGGDVSQLTHG